MNISIPESTEIVMELIEVDNADSQTSCEIYAGATALVRVLNISKSVVIKICVWSGVWVLVFFYGFNSKHFPLRYTFRDLTPRCLQRRT
jgi:phosphate starvation-inducible membrane PsiE